MDIKITILLLGVVLGFCGGFAYNTFDKYDEYMRGYTEGVKGLSKALLDLLEKKDKTPHP